MEEVLNGELREAEGLDDGLVGVRGQVLLAQGREGQVLQVVLRASERSGRKRLSRSIDRRTKSRTKTRSSAPYLQGVHVRLLRDTLHVQPVQRPQIDAPGPLRLESEASQRRSRRRTLPAPAAMLVEVAVEERGGGRRPPGHAGPNGSIIIIVPFCSGSASFSALHHHTGACKFWQQWVRTSDAIVGVRMDCRS